LLQGKTKTIGKKEEAICEEILSLAIKGDSDKAMDKLVKLEKKLMHDHGDEPPVTRVAIAQALHFAAFVIEDSRKRDICIKETANCYSTISIIYLLRTNYACEYGDPQSVSDATYSQSAAFNGMIASIAESSRKLEKADVLEFRRDKFP